MNDDELSAQILAAFGVKPWDAGLAPVPLRLRAWRKITLAYRRRKAVVWLSYSAAEAEARAADEAYAASLPGRMRDAAAEVNQRYAHLLPEGMRFERGNSA